MPSRRRAAERVVVRGGGGRDRGRARGRGAWSWPARPAPLAHAPAEDADADADDQQRRDEVQPRVELVGDDELREASVTRPSAKTPIVCVTVTISPRQHRVPRRAARADQVGGDDRLAVPGRERVRRAPEERDAAARASTKPALRCVADDQAREAASRRRRSRRAASAWPREQRRAARRVVRRDRGRAPSVTSSGLESRSFGYARSSSLRALERVAPPPTTISFQPIRSGVVRVAVVEPRSRRRAAGRARTTSSRVVCRPPAPGGMRERVRDGTSRAGRPSTRRGARSAASRRA